MPKQIDLLKVTIESERLVLIPTSTAYSTEIFREFNDDAILEFMNTTPKTIQEINDFLDTARHDMMRGEKFVCAILKKETKEFIGHLSILNLNTSTPGVAIWIRKSAHGSGYGTEATQAMKNWLDANIDYTYLIYPVANANVASKKIPQSLGGIAAKQNYEFTKIDGAKVLYTDYWIYKS